MINYIIDLQARAIDAIFDQLERASQRANANHHKKQRAEIPARIEAAKIEASNSKPHRRLRLVSENPRSRAA